MFVLVKEGRVQMSVPLLSFLPGFKKKKWLGAWGKEVWEKLSVDKWEEMIEDDSSSLLTYSS